MLTPTSPPSPSTQPSLTFLGNPAHPYAPSPPIVSPALSLATHPDFSHPLSAVLRAGELSPGTRYSPSPSVATLSSLLANLPHPQPRRTATDATTTTSTSTSTSANTSGVEGDFGPRPSRRGSTEGGTNLTAWWDSLATMFGNESGSEKSSRMSSRQSSTISGEAPSTPSASRDSSSAWTPFAHLASGDSPSCESARPTPDASGIGIGIGTNREGRPFNKPKYPLVLCHGLLGFDLLGPQGWPPLRISYWRGVREALEQEGVEVHVARVPASASIEERARILADFIERELEGRKVNLIGHSMGGLDCRFMITHLKPTSFKIASLTTIGTPHRGSAFADYLLLDILGRTNVSRLQQLTTALGIPGGGKAFEELTVASMARFNAVTPDEPQVAYFSYGASFQPSFASLFRLPWSVIYEREGPNDGLVSVKSAQWGTYLGTLEDVHHVDLVGWTGRWKKAYADWTGKSGFHAVSFFLDVAESLAEKGF